MTEAIFILKDGRKLSYAVYGPATGQPVLYFHGTPSSRREILLLAAYGVDVEALLVHYNLRLIAPDRGALTTYHPQRTFRSFTNDSMELLQHLGVYACPVLCWSGGGPYALTAAFYYPGVVSGVYILCGITKRFSRDVLRQMGLNKYYFLAARYVPLLLQAALRVIRRQPAKSLPGRRLTGLPPIDYRLLQKATKEVAALTLKEAVRKGTKAAVHEANMYFANLGFTISDIWQPIHFWWGTKDTAVVQLHAIEIEQKSLQPVMYYRQEEGHLSLYIHCFAEALEAIARASAAGLSFGK